LRLFHAGPDIHVESQYLTAQIVAWINEGMRPENSHRVLVEEDGAIELVSEYDGK
jgi:hypothetical protein